MKRNLFLLLLLFCGQQAARAQTGFYEEGYIIQATDTLSGLLERTDEVALSQQVRFKANSSAAPMEFSPQQLAGFGFTQAKLHFRPVRVSIRQENGRANHTRFAKVLVVGPVSLFQLPLQEREQAENSAFVFVLQQDTAFHTLSQFKMNVGSRSGVENRYRGSLSALLKDCPALLPQINRLPYQPAPLANLVQQYNTCATPNATSRQYTFKVPPVLKHGPEAGMGTVFTPGRDLIYGGRTFTLGYFWDLLKPESSRRISYRYGLNYLHVRYFYDTKAYNGFDNTWYKTKHTGYMHILRAPLLGQFNVNNAPGRAFSPFVNLGITGQISSRDDVRGVDIVPFFTLGTGFYYQKLRVSLNLDNDGFLLKGDKFATFSLGWRLDATASEAAIKP